MKKAFSLLELIFVISILAISTYFILSSSFISLKKANILKIKSEISLINYEIKESFTSSLLKDQKEEYLDFLDDADINTSNETLFDGYNDAVLLDPTIFSSTKEEKSLGKWIKIEQKKYRIYITSKEYIDFIYDNQKGTFSCSFLEKLCKELSL